MLRPAIRRVLNSRPMKPLYNPLKRWRMTRKIILFQSSQARSFTISRSIQQSNFSVLASRFGSDKDGILGQKTPFAWPPHTYGTFYEFLFSHRRELIKNIFECGIGSTNTEIESNMGRQGQPGASLRVWREYFPNCEITAVDIDEKALITESRISSYQLDQTDEKSIEDFWKNHSDLYFDLMIDDGLHNVHAGMTLLRNSIGRLRSSGYYIIEDVSVNDLNTFSSELTRGNFDFYIVSLARPKEFGFDNNLIVIRASV